MPKGLWWVWASLMAMTLAACGSLFFRFKAERSNRAVGIVMEGQSLHELATSSGRDFIHLVTELKPVGLSGVALTEETVGDLLDRGSVTMTPNPGAGVVIMGAPSDLARIARAITRRSGMASSLGKSNPESIHFDGDVGVLRATSVGLDPLDATIVRESGLLLIARHANAMGSGPAYIRDILQESKELGAVAFLPAGDQVLGQRASIEDTAAILADLDLDYLTPEFAKISGDSKLSAQIPERTIRLHSMQQAEVDKSSEGAIVDRYNLAYRERNVRWLLVRPVSFGGGDTVLLTKQFLNTLKESLVHAGGGIKKPRPYTDPKVPRFLFVAIGLLAVPWMFWALSQFTTSRLWTGVFAVVSAGVGLASVSESLRPVSALAIGVAGPAAAYWLWVRSEPKTKSAVLDLLKISAVSLASGLAVAGLLNGLPYFIEVKQALGVKAVLIGPSILVTWMLVKRAGDSKSVLQEPVRWGPLLTGLVLIGAVAFLAIRSGNDAPSAVSDGELKFRALLDQLFYTRPRTKEILIGHPALLLGLLLHYKAKAHKNIAGWATVLLCVGAIGQSDIVDTMCHTHTPLDIGLARIVIGLVLGGIIGALLWVPVRAWADRQEGT